MSHEYANPCCFGCATGRGCEKEKVRTLICTQEMMEKVLFEGWQRHSAGAPQQNFEQLDGHQRDFGRRYAEYVIERLEKLDG
jgi:hypothetical protein